MQHFVSDARRRAARLMLGEMKWPPLGRQRRKFRLRFSAFHFSLAIRLMITDDTIDDGHDLILSRGRDGAFRRRERECDSTMTPAPTPILMA